MKKLSLLLLVFTLGFANYGTAQDAQSILNEALQQANADDKNVFVMYTASWCSWCKKMQANIDSEACLPLFESQFEMVTFDVMEPKTKKNLETPGGNKLLNEMGGKEQGIPYWVILDRNGEVLTNSISSQGFNLGCPATQGEVEEFIQKLQESATFTDTELDTIATQFLQK